MKNSSVWRSWSGSPLKIGVTGYDLSTRLVTTTTKLRQTRSFSFKCAIFRISVFLQSDVSSSNSLMWQCFSFRWTLIFVRSFSWKKLSSRHIEEFFFPKFINNWTKLRRDYLKKISIFWSTSPIYMTTMQKILKKLLLPKLIWLPRILKSLFQKKRQNKELL